MKLHVEFDIDFLKLTEHSVDEVVEDMAARVIKERPFVVMGVCVPLVHSSGGVQGYWRVTER